MGMFDSGTAVEVEDRRCTRDRKERVLWGHKKMGYEDSFFKTTKKNREPHRHC